MQCSAVYLLVIRYCHHLFVFGYNARQVDMASFLPTNPEIILLAESYNILARKSLEFRHKEILESRNL